MLKVFISSLYLETITARTCSNLYPIKSYQILPVLQPRERETVDSSRSKAQAAAARGEGEIW